MPLFFIEMGQGIIARPEVRVMTSTLHSCTLITGWSNTTGFGGAYHYPSDRQEDDEVLAAMALWAFYLKPTVVKLLFARRMLEPMGTKDSDKAFLRQWVTDETGVIPTSGDAVAARMRLTANLQFSAGDGASVPGEFDDGARDLRNIPAGDNSGDGFILVGRNLER
jgi:hypothetical protein